MRPARSPLRPALSHEADSRLTLLRPRQPFWPVARYPLTQRLLAGPVMRADTELESSRLPGPPPAHSLRSEALCQRLRTPLVPLWRFPAPGQAAMAGPTPPPDSVPMWFSRSRLFG